MAKGLKPLSTNPGGSLNPEQVIGRDELIQRYWDLLQSRSLALLAPRRIGKTCICRRMDAFPPPQFRTIFRSLEGRKRVEDFVQLLYGDVSTLLSGKTRLSFRARDLIARLTGSVELSGVKVQFSQADWRQILDAIFADLDAYAADEGRLVTLIWDEFTLFIRDLDINGQSVEAMALMDLLRAARQANPRVRMIFTGSIGLDEVIDVLKSKGYGNDPTNDMAKEIVPLLEPEAARQLAACLLLSFPAGIAVADRLSPFLARLCEHHPFLIQHVAERLKYGGTADEKSTVKALDALLFDSKDPLEVEHYLERLDQYLPPVDAQLARKILDTVATEPGLGATEIAQRIQGDREMILRILRSLRKDLYLEREGRGYRFRLQFVHRWWMVERDL